MASNPSLYPPLPQAPYCTHLLLTSSPPPPYHTAPGHKCTYNKCIPLHCTNLHHIKLNTHYTILHLFTHQQVLCTLCALCRRILRLRNLRKVAFIATLTAHPLHPELYCRLPPSPTCHQAALCLSTFQENKRQIYKEICTKTQQTDIDEHNPNVNHPAFVGKAAFQRILSQIPCIPINDKYHLITNVECLSIFLYFCISDEYSDVSEW